MSRETVLALLRRQEGDFVSGEEISRQLGLSRAAVWKAVDALRRTSPCVPAWSHFRCRCGCVAWWRT